MWKPRIAFERTNVCPRPAASLRSKRNLDEYTDVILLSPRSTAHGVHYASEVQYIGPPASRPPVTTSSIPKIFWWARRKQSRNISLVKRSCVTKCLSSDRASLSTRTRVRLAPRTHNGNCGDPGNTSLGTTESTRCRAMTGQGNPY